MNILIITSLYPTDDNSFKDKTKAIHYFAKIWSKNGNSVKVIKLNTKFPLFLDLLNTSRCISNSYWIDDIEVFNISITRFPKYHASNFFVNKTIKGINRKLSSIVASADSIVSHMGNPSLKIGCAIKNKYNKPLIFTLHNSDIFYLRGASKRKKDEYLSHLLKVDKIGFRSNSIEEKFDDLNLSNYEYKNRFIIPSGVQSKYILTKDEVKKKVNIKTKKILFAGQLIPLKKVDVLIGAFSKLIKDNNDIELIIIGDGKEREKLETLVKKLNLRNSIIFKGILSRDETLQEMEKSDVFAMVSSPETFGLVYVEALAKGCIVIGSKGEGIDGTIHHGENGFLCTPNDERELYLTLKKALELNFEEKYNILSNANVLVHKYSQEKLANEYLGNILGLLDV